MNKENYFKIMSLIATIDIMVSDEDHKKIEPYINKLSNIIEHDYLNGARECDMFPDDSAELINN